MTPYETELPERGPGVPATSATAADVVLACLAQIRPGAVPPTPDEDLLRGGLLDSLGFVELLFALEERSGMSIDLDAELDAANAARLSTVAGLAEHFFGTDAPQADGA
jgi:acyl carrier protein